MCKVRSIWRQFNLEGGAAVTKAHTSRHKNRSSYHNVACSIFQNVFNHGDIKPKVTNNWMNAAATRANAFV